MKKRIEQLEQELTELKKQLEEPDFDVGDWVVQTGFSKPNLIKHKTGIGFFANEWDNHLQEGISETKRKATPEEIESALIEEAKRRGFKVGATANNSNVSFDDEFKDYTLESGRNFKYDYKYDTLSWSDSEVCWDIYCKGKWAEIIEEKNKFFDWYVEYVAMTNHDSNSLLVEIGCETYPKTFLKDLKQALGYLEDYTVKEVINELEKLDL